jgi:hypothetical protein
VPEIEVFPVAESITNLSVVPFVTLNVSARGVLDPLTSTPALIVVYPLRVEVPSTT